jgi:hypothetical protein
MTLTKKQEAQIAKAAKGRRASLRAMFERQNAQSQAAPAKKATSAQPRRAKAMAKPGPKPPTDQLTHAFNAFVPRHLPFDETTAPYTVTNLVGIIEFESSHLQDKILVVAPRIYNTAESYGGLVLQGPVGPMTDYLAVLYAADSAHTPSVPYIKSLRSAVIGAPAHDVTAQLFSTRGRLYNMSAKIECLGMNNGLLPPGAAYIGRVPTLETYSYHAETADAADLLASWVEPAISTGLLQSVPAASLVSNPLTLHATVAETVAYKQWYDFAVPGSTTNIGNLPISKALEPILVYVPKCGAAGAEVNYRITVGQEWCTRHPNNVLLRATQKQHDATPPGVWRNAVASAKRVGDSLLGRVGAIAETYAMQAGHAALTAMTTARASSLPAIAYVP